MTTLDTATTLTRSGASIIPIRTDGSKSPALDEWTPFQTRIANQSELKDWFGNGHRPGLAVVCGGVSGNLEILDFDEVNLIEPCLELICSTDAGALLLKKVVQVRTPSGGLHLIYRCNEISPNLRLARRLIPCGGENGKDKIETLIETRGEGGYALLPGCPPECHRDRKIYQPIQGDLTKIPTITPVERAILLDSARSFNEYVRASDYDERPRANGNSGDRPGDRFNREASWKEVLEPHGWKHVYSRGDVSHWRRPGKEGPGISATTNYNGSNLLCVFSSNAYPFETERGYSKFSAYGLLNHDGDFEAAARELGLNGYGATRDNATPFPVDADAPENPLHHHHGGHDGREPGEDDEPYPPVQAQEPEKFKVPDHWRWLDVSKIQAWNCPKLTPLIESMMMQGSFVFVAAQSQTGKTLLWLYIALMMTVGGKLFGKFAVTAGNKVLYMMLEDRDIRAEIRLKDFLHEFPELPGEGQFIVHVAHGFTLTDPKTVAYLRSLVAQHGFNVIVLDTYQRATPGISSFNDEEQSKILHNLANFTRETGVTLVVNDHVRKDDKARKRATLSLDDIKGTGGKVQNADSVILMERCGQDQIKLQCFSKDFDKRVGVLVGVSPQGSTEPKFTYLGELSELGNESKKKGDENTQKLLQAMRPAVSYSCSELEKLMMPWDRTTTYRHRRTLIKDGRLIETGRGKNKRFLRKLQSADATDCNSGEQDLFSQEVD